MVGCQRRYRHLVATLPPPAEIILPTEIAEEMAKPPRIVTIAESPSPVTELEHREPQVATR
uniref:Uncharacterized protein n=1 Tax=Nelumbo nucifera TaxID=4432 RepID=A0A822ZNW3_NELNU|nr:TPA_asm: hypothetical protein HUJ06_016859 [Nelumbo nucifera]